MGASTRRARFRGCLLGGALGDALGAPVEFTSLEAIVEAHGPGGPSELGTAYGVRGAITDDTQMTLWTADGLLRSLEAPDRRASVHAAYLRWLATQDGRRDGADGWLATHDALWSRRAPGNTCLSALRSGAVGTTDAPVNGSKGCGGVMRVAPAGLLMATPEAAFEAGAEAAAITHGHPSGYVAAGAFAAAVAVLRDGAGLEAALDRASTLAAAAPGGAETVEALGGARRLAASGLPDAEAVEALAVVSPGSGPGWVAEEALAVGALCALRHPADVEAALRAAVTHTGDSDSTGALCGHLLGAALGDGALPARWLEALELADIVRQVADDLYAAAEGLDAGLEARYPAR